MALVMPMYLVQILEVILGTFFFSFLFYLSVSFLKRYKKKPIWNSRTLTDIDCYDISIKVATFVFSVMSWLSAAITIYNLNDKDILEDKFWLLHSWVYFSAGYYIYDTVMKPYCFGLEANIKGGLNIFIGFCRSQPLMMLHHIITLAFFYPTLMWFRNGKGDFIVACFFLMDFAVPFIQIRHVMYRLGLANMPLYLCNGIVLVVTFFLSRIFLLYYIYRRYAQYRGVEFFEGVKLLPNPCNIGMASLLVMQGYWFGLMIKKLAKYLLSHGKADVVSTIQAGIAVCVGLIVMINCRHDMIYDSHWLTNAYGSFGVPYFYYDLVVMSMALYLRTEPLKDRRMSSNWHNLIPALKLFWVERKLMFLHHFALPLMFYPSLLYFRNGLGDFVVGGFYVFELPVPYIQTRHILAKLDRKASPVYVSNGLVMLGAMLIGRILMFPYLYYCYAQYRGVPFSEVLGKIPIKCTISCIILGSLQVYWFFIMLRGTVSYFRKVIRQWLNSNQRGADNHSPMDNNSSGLNSNNNLNSTQ